MSLQSYKPTDVRRKVSGRKPQNASIHKKTWMTFIEFELRSHGLWLPLIYWQAVVPLPPMLDALIFVFVEDAGVKLTATQVAVHQVRCCSQLWACRSCFCRVLRGGAWRGQTLSSMQWTHAHTHSDTVTEWHVWALLQHHLQHVYLRVGILHQNF